MQLLPTSIRKIREFGRAKHKTTIIKENSS